MADEGLIKARLLVKPKAPRVKRPIQENIETTLSVLKVPVSLEEARTLKESNGLKWMSGKRLQLLFSIECI